jgi:hypothetical protein
MRRIRQHHGADRAKETKGLPGRGPLGLVARRRPDPAWSWGIFRVEAMIMGGREEYSAGREALQEVVSQPERERPHESAIARFVAGLAYAERQHTKDVKERKDDQPS